MNRKANRTTIRIATLIAAVTIAGAAAAQTTSFLSPAPLTDAGWMPHPAVKKASRLAMEAVVPTPIPVAAPAPAPLPVLQERDTPAGPALRREVTVTGETRAHRRPRRERRRGRRRGDLPRARSRPDRQRAGGARASTRCVRITSSRSTRAASTEVAVTRASRAITREGDRGAPRARARRTVTVSPMPSNLAVTFDNEVRTLHIEPRRRAAHRPPGLRPAQRPLRRDVRAARRDARRSLRLTGTLRRDRRGGRAAARRSRKARWSSASDVMIERRPKSEFAADVDRDRGQAVGLAAKRALRAGPGHCARPT